MPGYATWLPWITFWSLCMFSKPKDGTRKIYLSVYRCVRLTQKDFFGDCILKTFSKKSTAFKTISITWQISRSQQYKSLIHTNLF